MTKIAISKGRNHIPSMTQIVRHERPLVKGGIVTILPQNFYFAGPGLARRPALAAATNAAAVLVSCPIVLCPRHPSEMNDEPAPTAATPALKKSPMVSSPRRRSGRSWRWGRARAGLDRFGPSVSAGKILMKSEPASCASYKPVGVYEPSMIGLPAFCAIGINSRRQIGLTMNCAPASIAA